MLIDARRSEAMTNAALEMERAIASTAWDDRTLERVYQNQRKRYSEMLDARRGLAGDKLIRRCVRI